MSLKTPNLKNIFLADKGTTISWVILLLLALVVGYFSALSPWLNDDLTYQYHSYWANWGIWVPINTIGDVFNSQYHHYFFVNGRYVAHFIVQLFDGVLGQICFAIANAIVYILFVRMIMLICNVKMTNWTGTLTVTCMVILFQCVRMTPAFQMYVWMYLLILCFIRVFFNYHTKNPWILFLLCIFSLLAGNAHESFNPGVVVGLGIFILFHIKKITLQQWLMFGFFIIGLMMLLFSPATQNRMIDTCPWILEWRLLAFYSLITVDPALVMLFFVTIYMLITRRKEWKKIFQENLIWWLIWGSCFLIAMYWGFSGGRALLGEELCAVILVVRMIRKHSFTPFWLTLLTLATCAFIFIQYGKLQKLLGYIDEIELQAKNNPDGNIFIDYQYSPHILELEDYSGQIDNVNFLKIIYFKRYVDLFSKHYTKKWGVDHDIRLYPTGLRPYIYGNVDTTDVNKGNKLIEYAPGIYLLIKNKKHPAKFYANYERVAPFMYKKYAPQEVDFPDLIYEDENWEACILDKYLYSKVYPATLTMTPPAK